MARVHITLLSRGCLVLNSAHFEASVSFQEGPCQLALAVKVWWEVWWAGGMAEGETTYPDSKNDLDSHLNSEY